VIFQDLTTSFKKELLEGVHDFRVGQDVFKMALYSSSANLSASTTAYTATGEISASGYTSGGIILPQTDPGSGGTVGYVNFTSVSWSGASIAARGALIYNSTPSTGSYTNPSVMVIDFGMERVAASGTFTVTMPTNDQWHALIRIADSNA
jgi:hypothetical protein